MFVMINQEKDKPSQISLAVLDDFFSSLSHSVRREIISVLVFRGRPVSSGEIAERFPLSWPTITSHLKYMKNAKLVMSYKKANSIYYELNPEVFLNIEKAWWRPILEEIISSN